MPSRFELVAQIGDALDPFLLDQIADAFDQRGLVDLIWNLGNDDRLAFPADGLEFDLAAHHNRATAEVISGANALVAENDAAGREIRSGDDLDEVIDPE